MNHLEKIIKFFLHIFQLQSGVSGLIDGVGEYHLVSSDADSARIYELRIKVFSGWKTRRMSIRQIGEAGHSKSTCYAATYDDLLVIKMPPHPLSDFKKYLENINLERSISNQLSPDIHCLSPSLSSILSKVPDLAGKIPQGAKEVEEGYLGLLIKEQRYQGHLKIGDRFAFFMSLSKHPFFDQVIEKIHGNKKWMQDEGVRQSRLFQSLDAFETVHGSKKIDLYFAVNDMMSAFSRKIDSLLSSYDTISHIEEYQKLEWLFARLSEKKSEFDHHVLPPKLCEDIDGILTDIVQEKMNWVEDYRKTVSAYIRKKNFEKNRSQIEILIIKALELIYHLKQKGVAVRDLKPDNILVMGDAGGSSSGAPDPGSCKLGLIDFETAVNFLRNETNSIHQPMLAGTAPYMTPSHVFENRVLTEVFGADIARIFYMQDWFSAVGIIYTIATGGLLFKKTARLIPEIMRAQRKGVQKKIPAPELLRSISRSFWKTAGEELSEKLRGNEEFLHRIRLTLPEEIIDMFQKELEKEKKILIDMIAFCARTQKFFPRNTQDLIEATYEEIRGQRMKLERYENNTQMPPDIRQKILKLFEFIENMKFKLRDFPRLERQIQQPVACDEFLTFLFRRVMNAMNRESFLKEKSENQE